MGRVVFVLLVATSLAACSSSPTAPSPSASLSGVWSGAVSRGGTSATLRLEVQSTPFGTTATVSGRYDLADASGSFGGTVTGTLTRTQAALTLAPSSPPPCPGATPQAGQIALLVTLDGTRLGGEAVFTSCGAIELGTVSLSRQ
jgi:hypothetical protein